MARDFHSHVCLLPGRGGLGFLLGRRENSRAPCRVLLRVSICLPSSFIFIFVSRVGLPAKGGGSHLLQSPPPPVTPSLPPPHTSLVAPDQAGIGTSSHLLGSRDGFHQAKISLFDPWNQAMEGQEITRM